MEHPTHRQRSVGISERLARPGPFRGATLTYVVSLSLVALLSLVVHLMLDRAIAEQSRTVRVINVSGLQRMFSQRATLFALEYIRTGQPAAREEALAAMRNLQSNQDFLLREHRAALAAGQPSPLSETLRAMYFRAPMNVSQQMDDFLAELSQVLSMPRPEAQVMLETQGFHFMRLAREELLTGLDSIVSQFERESVARIAWLRTVQQVVLVIVILIILLEALFIFRPMTQAIQRVSRRFYEDVQEDALTGLLRRRAFTHLARRQVFLARRRQQSATLLLLDIDGMGRINACCGEAQGDALICEVGALVQRCCRESDLTGRLAGDEFAILLPSARLQDAWSVAKALREGVAQIRPEGELPDGAVSASIGMAECRLGEDGFADGLRRASAALVQARDSGGNRICVG